MDIFQNKIIYSYKIFRVFGISLITQIIVFENKLLGRCFFPDHYFSQKWLHKIETFFKPKTCEWQDTHTTNTKGDHDSQLIAHTSSRGMHYDAKNKNKDTIEDWNLGKNYSLWKCSERQEQPYWNTLDKIILRKWTLKSSLQTLNYCCKNHCD